MFGVAGWRGSGKTTLLTALVGEFVARGLSVSTIKHAHHNFEVDQPGKDSYRHRAAGAHEVLVTSTGRWSLMHELRGAPEPPIEDLVARMTPVDLLLIEGFKRHSHDKIEVCQVGTGRPLLALGDPHVVAVAANAPISGLAVPVFDRNDVAGIAAFVARHCGLAELRKAVT
jgi:molybdopterin-guanine dinucleotide biosynthesis protein B